MGHGAFAQGRGGVLDEIHRLWVGGRILTCEEVANGSWGPPRIKLRDSGRRNPSGTRDPGRRSAQVIPTRALGVVRSTGTRGFSQATVRFDCLDWQTGASPTRRNTPTAAIRQQRATNKVNKGQPACINEGPGRRPRWVGDPCHVGSNNAQAAARGRHLLRHGLLCHGLLTWCPPFGCECDCPPHSAVRVAV